MESVLAAVNCCCSCWRVVYPKPSVSIVDLMAIRLVIVVFVSKESVCVGPMSDRASLSLRFADAETTWIPELMAESKSAARGRMVEGTGGLAMIAASRALTAESTLVKTLTTDVTSRSVSVGYFSTSVGLEITLPARGASNKRYVENFIVESGGKKTPRRAG